jgi:outer membrane protein OmpA-like peptidoglycan-associated protein
MKSFVVLLLLMLSLGGVQAQKLVPVIDSALVKVKALDDSDIPQANSRVSFTDKISKRTFTCTTDATGEFSVLLPTGRTYTVKYKAFVDVETDLELNLPKEKNPYMINYTITVAPPRYFTLDNVNFDSGKSSLRVESFKSLNELVDYLKLKPKMVIEIAGHTDNIGNSEVNLKLSQERANTVKSYLLKKGIPASRVKAQGYGDNEPISSNDTPEGRQQNRRTEVRILSE